MPLLDSKPQAVYARFKGPAPSLGYEPGKEYALLVNEVGSITRLVRGWPANWRIMVRAPHPCPYSTYRNFNQNWEVLHADS